MSAIRRRSSAQRILAPYKAASSASNAFGSITSGTNTTATRVVNPPATLTSASGRSPAQIGCSTPGFSNFHSFVFAYTNWLGETLAGPHPHPIRGLHVVPAVLGKATNGVSGIEYVCIGV